MKILHINGAKTWGGNEQQLVDLIHSLEKKNVRNLVLGIKNKDLHDYCKKKNITFISAIGSKINSRKNFWYLYDLTTKYNPDIIHIHTSNALTLFVFSDFLYKLKTPAVFSKKGIGNSMSYLSKFKYNYKNIKHIICVSSTVKDFMLNKVIFSKNQKKISVIYDYVNTQRITQVIKKKTLKEIYNISNNTIILGNIANHFDAKDIETLINSLYYLVYSLKRKNVILIQIGKKTNLTKEFEILIDKYNLQKYLIFTGFIENASKYLNEFDVFTISSQREGGPSSVLEAFYCKVPVVSTKVGILPEIIKDGENGYLVDIKDHVNQAKKIEKLIENKNSGKVFAEKSYKIFNDNFTSEKAANKILKIYSEAIQNF
jgi:glycosyltransferase involved in cell wall biosynthesis